MKTVVRFGLLTVAILALSAAQAVAADIVDVEGNKPATVQLSDVVRITGKGIAGAEITIAVKGDGKLEATNRVRKVKDGHVLIGSETKEFLIRPTKKGKIAIKVTVKNPTADAVVQEYEVNVE
jgi:hypothetical protein